MGFLAPLMLVGVLAIVVPIAIHAIGRRRARVVAFAALEFIMATQRKTARQWQLRERILLLVRILVCVAVAIALAKPFASCEHRGPQVTRGPQAAAIVIDDSFASGYVIDGKPWLKRAGDEARKVLAQLGPEAEVAIVRASEGAEQPSELTRNHLRLRDQLLELEPTARPADTTRALSRAAQLLHASSSSRKTVFLLSLLANSGMSPSAPSWQTDGLTLVTLDLRPSSVDNFAVTQLEVSPDPAASRRGVAFDAEIANFGDTAATVAVSLSIADTIVARGQLELGPRERNVKRFLAALPPGTRATEAAVAIGHQDGLAADDIRYVRASVRDEVRVLLVDGDPRTVRQDDELFYFEMALRPGDRDDSGTQVHTITAEELSGIDPKPRARAQAPAIDLNDFDVIVLANVPALPSDQVELLTNWVRAGGGILIASGERVDPSAYDRTMLPIMPQALRDPVDATWGAAAEDRNSRAGHLVKWEAEHPIFAPFSPEAPELADANFFKFSLLGPTTARDTARADGHIDRKVLARFTNGAPALVEASIGAGRTLLFTSTLDRDWNDLPIHPGYLPFAQQAVRHLARKHGRSKKTDHLVGNSIAIPATDFKKLEIRGPRGTSAVFEGDRLTNRSVVRFGRTDHPGVYRVIGTDRTGATRDHDELAFVVNLDPRGSDLAVAPSTALPASGTTGATAPASSQRRVELWHALAAILLLLLVAEGILVQR